MIRCRVLSAMAVVAAIAGTAAPGAPAIGADPTPARDETATFNLIEDNDSFINGSDKHYTQGLRLAWASGERQKDPGAPDGGYEAIADALFFGGADGARIRYGVFFGQSFFTPDDLDRRDPDPRDRPYAGWLYLGANLYRETDTVLDRAQVTLGVVGPAAGGEEVQNDFHNYTGSFIGGTNVQGWGSQLKNEPGLILTEERKWRLTGGDIAPFEFDFLPEVNASLGNVFTYGGIGGAIRIGRGLRADWGPPRVQPALSGSDFVNHRVFKERAVAWYLFAGGEVRAVGRNIFLDGNTFADSRSVDKKPIVADLTAGFSVLATFGRMAVTYTRRTKEFTTQVDEDEFVSITLGVLF
jgi:hypothetical protein